MKRVITYGTFDLLHYGHINLLKRAKQQGDYLIVALSTDEFNWNEKQKKSYFSYEIRKQLLEAIRYVDKVIKVECPAPNSKANDWQMRLKADIVFSGDDHASSPEWQELIEYKKKNGGKVKFLPYTKTTSSTILREKILNN